LAFDLEDAALTVTHDGKRGEVTETDWLNVIRGYLPNRYAVDSGIIIDSEGKTSDQIDIVIYDPHFTPVLLTRESNRYIPAEAVYAVFEAKPNIDKERMEYAGKKAASVRKLKRTSATIVDRGISRPPRPVFDIVSGIVAARVDWVDGFGESFHRVIESEALAGDNQIQCGCGLTHGAFDLFDGAGKLALGTEEAGLVFFLFRLLGHLQSIGSVPAIDWGAYASVLKYEGDI
tara:strand:- start:1907 stop:2602 length:696 start_codon:yes stop_codon:yes gene_type:complete